MANQVTGTRSTFGEQNISFRESAPKAVFGSSTRTDRIFQGKEFMTRNYGKDSAEFTTNPRSSFGEQVSSKLFNLPRPRIAGRHHSDTDMLKEELPGPGLYETQSALGKQKQSLVSTVPSWKFGKSCRWSDYASSFQPQFETPAASKIQNEEFGSTAGWKLHGNSKRYDICAGLPGCTPSNVFDPGPGAYQATSSFGNQVVAVKQSMPRAVLGKARPTASEKMYISYQHQRRFLCKESPAPGLYKPTDSIGKQLNSLKRTSPNLKFGTSDRFSDVKFQNISKDPGPGSYVI